MEPHVLVPQAEAFESGVHESRVSAPSTAASGASPVTKVSMLRPQAAKTSGGVTRMAARRRKRIPRLCPKSQSDSIGADAGAKTNGKETDGVVDLCRQLGWSSGGEDGI